MRAVCQRVGAVALLAVLELYRRRDLLVAFILASVILVPLASLNLFGVQGVVRYLQEVALLLVWVFSIIIGLGTAARQLSAELDSRTIYPLLSKPIRRGEVLVGKYFGALVATASCTLLFYACYAVLGLVKGGLALNLVFVQALLLHLAFLAVLTALVICGSTLLTPSANLTCGALLTAGMLLFGERLAGIAASAPLAAKVIAYGAHIVLPHFEFFDLRQRIIHSWEPVSAGVTGAVLLYAALYSAALLGFSIALFNRRKL